VTLMCRFGLQDGVVLGADTRSTAGTVVADKNCEKIHPITDKIFCCGAGTAADCEMVTGMVASTMKLHQYATGRPSRVVTVKTILSQHLFKYQGHIGAALVLGGVDLNGPHLYSVRSRCRHASTSLLQPDCFHCAGAALCFDVVCINLLMTDSPSCLQVHPHGSVDCLPFDAMGSGSLNAMSMLETKYRDDMSKEEAMDLVAAAIKFGALWTWLMHVSALFIFPPHPVCRHIYIGVQPFWRRPFCSRQRIRPSSLHMPGQAVDACATEPCTSRSPCALLCRCVQ
jgi:20S proteasome alpha/beta subunit